MAHTFMQKVTHAANTVGTLAGAAHTLWNVGKGVVGVARMVAPLAAAVL
jgi:hypothetical protein